MCQVGAVWASWMETKPEEWMPIDIPVMQHTPGPWVHHTEDNIITTHGGRLTLEWQARSNHAMSGDMPTVERDANARLVAAAPDLLAALDAVMYWDNGKPEWDDARAAIAKAVGYNAVMTEPLHIGEP